MPFTDRVRVEREWKSKVRLKIRQSTFHAFDTPRINPLGIG